MVFYYRGGLSLHLLNKKTSIPSFITIEKSRVYNIFTSYKSESSFSHKISRSYALYIAYEDLSHNLSLFNHTANSVPKMEGKKKVVH